MSVKEAREAVEGHFDWGHEDDPASYAAVDRLILEVQAAMPCYGWPCEWSDDVPVNGFLITTLKLCPPHVSKVALWREQLKVTA